MKASLKMFGLALLVALALAGGAAGGDPAYRAQFVGGTFTGVPPKSQANLKLTAPDALIFESRGQTLNIPYAKIGSLEYGQTVGRRYAAAILISPMFLLTKTRQHFVTIGYTDGDRKQQALIFRVDKRDIRSVLTTLETRSGRRVEYQDEEARRTGR